MALAHVDTFSSLLTCNTVDNSTFCSAYESSIRSFSEYDNAIPIVEKLAENGFTNDEICNCFFCYEDQTEECKFSFRLVMDLFKVDFQRLRDHGVSSFSCSSASSTQSFSSVSTNASSMSTMSSLSISSDSSIIVTVRHRCSSESSESQEIVDAVGFQLVNACS